MGLGLHWGHILLIFRYSRYGFYSRSLMYRGCACALLSYVHTYILNTYTVTLHFYCLYGQIKFSILILLYVDHKTYLDQSCSVNRHLSPPKERAPSPFSTIEIIEFLFLLFFFLYFFIISITFSFFSLFQNVSWKFDLQAPGKS